MKTFTQNFARRPGKSTFFTKAVVWFCCLFVISLASGQIPPESHETLVDDYVPYLHGKPWPSPEIVRYVENSNVWVHPSSPKNFPTLQEVVDPDADFLTVLLRLPNGRVYKTYNELGQGPYIDVVYSGDFNGDGLPDFFVICPTTACGIAAEQRPGLFAFSNGTNGYSFTRIHGYGLGRHSLVLDPITKTFRFMHTNLCDAKGPDGSYHSFWVHRLFRWEDASMRLDSHYPAMWVQYLYRPNHETTKMLNSLMKAKAWAEDRDYEETIEW
jgi:hypothetical protein